MESAHTDPALAAFCPAVGNWFAETLGSPTPVQAGAWEAIGSKEHVLIAAPTGSGKTLSAFLSAIDGLVREGQQQELPEQCRVLYISPLKALSNDIHKNLQQPLAGIADALLESGQAPVDIRAAVRTGDTSQAERARMAKHPPHLLVTTPESLYILLGSDSGRAMLGTVQAVIVDEIHALVGSKRGAHLALSLARLDALCAKPPQRIGLSATQKPIAKVAAFLTGQAPCRIVDTGHSRRRDLALALPESPLTPVMAGEVWTEIYEQLASLVRQHRTTLIFVNTRRLAERAARHLADRIGEEHVTSHHGSLSKEHRLEAEQKLKSGQLQALVATASLELGIDIGDVDLVCQIGSARGIATLLQRVGRSGHAVGAVPKGRVFPTTLDELVECAATLEAVRRGELDALPPTPMALDVLAQQLVAEVACREWEESALFELVRRAQPYAELSKERFIQVVRMLAEGYTTRRGRRGAHLHRDAVQGQLRARRGARLIALTNGGVIPDQFDYDVILLPQGLKVGTLNEDFAFESLPGDIFQLGNQSYKVHKVETGRVLVEDAHGQPPSIPFWFGQAPGRTDELSAAVSRLRQQAGEQIQDGLEAGCQWLQKEYGLDTSAAEQLADYLGAGQQGLGAMPHQGCIVLERFFDETGDMHLVLHSTFGSRINRAWGLALRKRFCRQFNFELQAAALEDSIVLSLGITHSFPLEEVSRYLSPSSVRDVLIQALLDAPMFPTQWRWNASVALAVRRHLGNRKSPPAFQRNDAEDLMAVVFPDQIACLENLSGPREIPDHPLVHQTIEDCLTEVMDIQGLEQLLTHLQSGQIQVVCVDTTAPSAFCGEILNARPYAFLDDGDAEARRTMAVRQPQIGFEEADRLRRLDPEAIARVRAEAWPQWRDADELHDALVVHGFLTPAEVAGHGTAAATLETGHDVVEGAGSAEGSFEQSRDTAQAPASGRPGEGVGAVVPAGVADRMSADEGRSDFRPAGATAPIPKPLESPLFLELASHRRAAVAEISSNTAICIAAERLAEVQAWAKKELPLAPPIEAVNGGAPSGNPLLELIRGRLEMLGPVSAEDLGAPLGLGATELLPVLMELENEGFVIRGRFSGEGEEWCERRLLARIHRYTLDRLRADIQPVSVQTYMRFLLDWQGLGEDTAEGSDALLAALDRLEGYSAPAGDWESTLLPARIRGYRPSQLDGLCAAGKIAWARIHPRRNDNGKATGPVRQSPIAFAPRAALPLWRSFYAPDADTDLPLSGHAQAAVSHLRQYGASFFTELCAEAHLLPAHAEQALGELVSWGLASADTFGGLRELIRPQKKRPRHAPRTRRRRPLFEGVQDAGRWSLLRPPVAEEQEALEHCLWALLSRYGVIFRKLLEREKSSPPWRKLLYVLWRMEARGEIRGGRFVDGFSGEQFALPEAVEGLRRWRKRPPSGRTVQVPASDPCNLSGILLPGDKVSSGVLVLQDGLPVEVDSAELPQARLR